MMPRWMKLFSQSTDPEQYRFILGRDKNGFSVSLICTVWLGETTSETTTIIKGSYTSYSWKAFTCFQRKIRDMVGDWLQENKPKIENDKEFSLERRSFRMRT